MTPRDRFDAITLDARLRYYAALRRTRPLTSDEDADRLHLTRCRLLRRMARATHPANTTLAA